MRRICIAVVVLIAFFTGAAWADTVTYSFGCITSNLALDCETGETYLTLDVIGGGQGFDFGNGPVATGAQTVLFRFYLSPNPLSPLSITDVYFDDGSLLAIGAIYSSPGVAFSRPASPPDLPGGTDIGFEVSGTPPLQWSADSDSGPPGVKENGVNLFGESLGVMFSLKDGQTYQDVLNNLDSEGLRVGVHVQGFALGGSESFVNDPESNSVTSIPETGTVQLLLIGIGLLATGGWYRKRHAQ